MFAQQKDKAIPINIGLQGAYFTQPGIKIGTVLNVKKWSIEKNGKTSFRTLYINPQIGIFVRQENHTSIVLNGDVGYRLRNSKRNIYIAPSVGFGYLFSNQLLSQKVDLGSGDIIGKDKQIRTCFLPTLNFEFGNEAYKKIGWYAKLSYGRKVSFNNESSAFFALELGLIFTIKGKNRQ